MNPSLNLPDIYVSDALQYFFFVIFLIQNYSLKFICQPTLRKQLKFNDIEAEIFCNCMLSAVKINVGTLFQILLLVLDKALC